MGKLFKRYRRRDKRQGKRAEGFVTPTLPLESESGASESLPRDGEGVGSLALGFPAWALVRTVPVRWRVGTSQKSLLSPYLIL